MWIRISREHLRRCPECRSICLKIAEPYDGEYLDDAEELGVCHECNENFAASVPGERS